MKLKVGFVGAGGIANEHFSVMREHDQVQVTAICDVVLDNAKRAAAMFGAAVYTDWETMLDSEKLDVLFLCIPPFAHGTIEEAAAERGIHLFVEKPVGLDREQALRKQEAIERAGIIAGTGYCLRYADTVQLAREFLQDKRIAMVRCHRPSGFIPAPWWRDMSKSGGQLVEMTTHNVDLIRVLAGDVAKVYANSALLINKNIEGNTIPDITSVNFEFVSGALGHLSTSNYPQPDERSSLEISGENFHLSFDGLKLTLSDQERSVVHTSRTSVYRAQDEAFIEAVLTGNRDLILAPYAEAVKTLEVTLAANESASTGLPVELTKRGE